MATKPFVVNSNRYDYDLIMGILQRKRMTIPELAQELNTKISSLSDWIYRGLSVAEKMALLTFINKIKRPKPFYDRPLKKQIIPMYTGPLIVGRMNNV